MATSVAPLTAEEFEQLPEVPGLRRELLEGVVHEMGTGGGFHELAKSNANEILAGYCLAHREFRLFPESMYRLSSHTSLIPDLSIRLRSAPRPQDPSRRMEGGPHLAVEIVSSESADYLESKVRAYYRAGAKGVWLIFPNQRVIRVCSPDGTTRTFEEDQTLADPQILPGFSSPVAAFFADL